MTVTRGVALSLALLTAAIGIEAAPWAAANGAAVPAAKLTAITSTLGARSASLVIEASEPVPYVATRPDPLTILLDFRNVSAGEAARMAKPDEKGPIAAVAIEAVESMGAPASRVRITLSQPVPHRIRSARNTVVVDLERPAKRGAPYVTPPASRQAAQAAPALVIPSVDPIVALGLTQPAAARQAPESASAPAKPAGLPASLLSRGPNAQDPSTQSSGRVYTGNPVSLDFQQADLRAVLRVFSEISGLNIVIDPAVQGTVDVALRDVPWDQALDIILRANKLGYIVDGTIVRIAPLTALADEEAQRRKLAEEQALAGELRVLTKTLSYARAEELQQLLLKSALSPRGTVEVDERTNTLIISDLQPRLTIATDLINTLDRAEPQVEIEARIVETRKNYARQLGVQWGFRGLVDPALGNTTNLAFPNKGSLAGNAGQVTNANLPALGGAAAQLALGSINGAFNLDAALAALERSGNVRILSTPRVSTQNNVEAEIAQGEQIPYQTVANNTVTVNFKDAALTLKVTPQITAAGTVIMKIAVDNGSRGNDVGNPPIPSINTQRALTTVQVTDGQTTVIGGIYFSRTSIQTERTPGLADVPLLKWLFKRDASDDQNRELLIFITPRIIQG